MRPRQRLFFPFLILVLAVLTWVQVAGAGRVFERIRGGKAAPARVAADRAGSGGGAVLRLAVWRSPSPPLHPLLGGDAADREVAALLYASLLRPALDLRLQPYLARTYRVSPDQRVIAFLLDERARWQDGAPVTARDVVRAVEVALRRKPPPSDLLAVAGAAAFAQGRARAISGLRVLGDKVLLVQLDRPWGPALTALGTLPLLPAAAGGTPVPPASGPFAVDRVVRDQKGRIARLVLRPNPGFPLDRPALGSLELIVLGGRPTLGTLRRLGIDVVSVRPEYAELLERNGYRVLESPRWGYYYVGFNMFRAPLHDGRFRQALAEAVDVEALVRTVVAGRGTPVVAPVYPGSWAEAPGLAPPRADGGRARSLLLELGYSDSDGDGFLDKGGKALTLNLAYSREDPVQAALATLIRKQLGAVGVRLYINGLSRDEFLRLVFRRRNFDLYLGTWRLGLDPALSRFLGGEAAANAVSFRPGSLDRLMGAADQTVDPRRREAYYRALTAAINRELPYLFLFAPNRVFAVSERVRWFWPGPEGFPAFAERWVVAS